MQAYLETQDFGEMALSGVGYTKVSALNCFSNSTNKSPWMQKLLHKMKWNSEGFVAFLPPSFGLDLRLAFSQSQRTRRGPRPHGTRSVSALQSIRHLPRFILLSRLKASSRVGCASNYRISHTTGPLRPQSNSLTTPEGLWTLKGWEQPLDFADSHLAFLRVASLLIRVTCHSKSIWWHKNKSIGQRKVD